MLHVVSCGHAAWTCPLSTDRHEAPSHQQPLGQQQQQPKEEEEPSSAMSAASALLMSTLDAEMDGDDKEANPLVALGFLLGGIGVLLGGG